MGLGGAQADWGGGLRRYLEGLADNVPLHFLDLSRGHRSGCVEMQHIRLPTGKAMMTIFDSNLVHRNSEVPETSDSIC